MKTEINHSAIEAALIKLGDASARDIANETGIEAKDVTRTLNDMRTAAAVEREKRGSEYVYWLTTSATVKPTMKPKAAAVAVQALHTPGSPADITEQLRLARAEHLAMSQTIVEICCAIGHDPAKTTTSQLPQLLRDYVSAQIERETAGQLSDRRYFVGHLDAIRPIAEELLSGYVTSSSPGEAVRTMSQLIDAQHAHLHAQIVHIEHLEAQVIELRARVEAQILASVENANSASHLLTEVHDALANGWPVGLEAPTGRTTLQLAQAMTKDFDDLHNTYLQTKFPTPDAYLVTRIIRIRRGKKVEDSGSPTRHKSIDTATRQARSVIRSGYARAEIHATTLVAVATLGPEIKSV